MMQKIQRFGGAMFTPILLFAFAGIMAGLSTLFMNSDIMGALAAPTSMWYKIWSIIEQGSWTIFNHMPLLFVIGLPIGLAKKQNARACLEALVIYLTFNYFLSAILTLWGPTFGVDFTQEVSGGTGLATVAGIKTLDMGMIGAILIAAIVVFLHNRFFDTDLPEFLGIFKGSTFIFVLGFFVMIPVAFLCALVWPKVQMGISSVQGFLSGAGTPGVGIYAFLNRILIPTGLHHFVNTPFLYDNVAVDGGTVAYWISHLQEFAASSEPLKDLFPWGGFSLYGMEKMFGSVGIALAFYFTAKKEKRKQVAGLLIPVTLTAVFAGVTEPLEFTFLFVAPPLFLVHSLLSACIDMTMYAFGVVGNFVGGAIEFSAQNWIPLWSSHSGVYIRQFVIGILYTGVWFVVFKFLIQKFNFKTPGREDDDAESKLFSKADFQEKKQQEKGIAQSAHAEKALAFLEALGGAENIDELTNCATRLRLTVRDESLVQDAAVFKVNGAHGLVVSGKSVQVIVGMTVPNVREEMETLMAAKAITE